MYSKIPNNRGRGGVLKSKGLKIFVKYNKENVTISADVRKWLIGYHFALFDQVDTFCIENDKGEIQRRY